MRVASFALAATMLAVAAPLHAEVSIQEFKLPAGAYPHDVAVGADGIVWYTAQRNGALGRLDPTTGNVGHIPLGSGSSPHGVIIGPDGAPWITDSGLNAIVRVDHKTYQVKTYPLPAERGYVNLNTPAFDGRGVLWFTGQNGVYGKLDVPSATVQVWDAPRGRGPYGIAATPDGQVYYASLAGSHIARINLDSSAATVIEPPTPRQGARRVWSDSKGMIWVSEWNSGNLSRFDPATNGWKVWRVPGDRPQPYAVYVDDEDKVWISDFGANAMVRFDPGTEKFEFFVSPRPRANVRQILGRKGEVWAPESGADHLVVYRTKPR